MKLLPPEPLSLFGAHRVRDALLHDRLGGVALDVVEHEPLHPSNPLFVLIDRDDFLPNPPIAWSSEDAMQQLMDSAVDNISDFAARQQAARKVRTA